MSISSALSAGVSGLAANSTRLANISDNIANSGTYGYKRVDTEFESMVINQGRGGGLYTAGGVRASTTRDVNERGNLVTTSNPLTLPSPAEACCRLSAPLRLHRATARHVT